MEEIEVYNDIFDVRFDNIPISSHLEGVIVEPRIHQHLSLVLRNFRYMLPEWSLTIYHSLSNKRYIEDILGVSHRVQMICFTDDNISIEEYSKLLMSKSFWNSLRGDKILVFQTDSFIRKRCISPYLGYDYIGAPWEKGFSSIYIDRGNGPVIHDIEVGNGGLSLRTRKVMIDIIDLPYMERYRYLPEDIFFSIGMLCMDGVRRCPVEVARSFSVERIYHPNPFAWHKAYAYWSVREWENLKHIDI